jgi:hypothetical protein
MKALIVRLDDHIGAVASCGGNPATTLAEVRLLLELRGRILALEDAGRMLLAIADQVNDVTHAGKPAQSDELADQLASLDSVVSGRAPVNEDHDRSQVVNRDDPVEFFAHKRDRMLRRA